MKVMAFKRWITILLLFTILLAFFPVLPLEATALPVVSVTAPPDVPVGGSFTARITVSQISAFVSYQLQLNYDKNVIQVIGPEGGPQGVTKGLIGTDELPVDMWAFNPSGSPTGSIRIVGRGPGNQSLGGAGYLADVHFNVVAVSPGQFTAITPTSTNAFINGFFDVIGNKLDTQEPWSPCLVETFRPLQINTSVLPDGAAGYLYSPGSSVNMVATGGTPPYTWNAQNLPTGLSISSSGTLSGVLDSSDSDNYSAVFHVDDAGGQSVDKTLNIRVYPVLQITTAVLPDAVKGTDYGLNNFSLGASGGKPGYTWSSNSLPTGLSISAPGMISGAPTVSGDFTAVMITVTDAFSPNHSLTRTFSLHIGGVIDISTAFLPDAKAGGSYSTTLHMTGAGIQPYHWNASGLPNGLSLDSLTGVISGTPGAAGNSNVTFSLTDSSSPQNSASRVLALGVYAPLSVTTGMLPRSAVEAGNNLPAVPGWVMGVAYNISGSLTASGGKGPYHWSASGLPSGITLADNGTFSGSASSFGLFSNITLTVTDSANPAQSASKTSMSLKIYKQGDANGDNDVLIDDVTYLERVIFGLNVPTAGCDSKLDGSISVGDVPKMERIILTSMN